MPISSHDKSETFTIASANILTAFAIRISDAPAFIKPFEPLFERIFVIPNKVALNAPSIVPIAANDFTILSGSISEMDLSATDKIPTAAAIPIRDLTFILVVNEDKVSFTPSKRSENRSFISLASPPLNKFLILSLTVSKTPDIFFATTNIPLPAKPANTSPADTLLVIQVNTFFTTSKIPFAESHITFLTPEKTSPSDSIFPSAGFMEPMIFLKVSKIPLDRVEKNSPSPVLSLSDVKKSPMKAVTLSNASTIPFNPPEPINFPIGAANAVIPFLKRSTTENTPLNVRLSLSAISPLTLRLPVNEWNLSINPLSCSEVAGGNTSLKASFTGFITSPSALKIFLKDSIIFSLPPSSVTPSTSLSTSPVNLFV